MNPSIPLLTSELVKITSKGTRISFHRDTRKWPNRKSILSPDLYPIFTFRKLSDRFRKPNTGRIRLAPGSVSQNVCFYSVFLLRGFSLWHQERWNKPLLPELIVIEVLLSPMNLLLCTYPYLLTRFHFPEGSVTFTTIRRGFWLAGHTKELNPTRTNYQGV